MAAAVGDATFRAAAWAVVSPRSGVLHWEYMMGEEEEERRRRGGGEEGMRRR